MAIPVYLQNFKHAGVYRVVFDKSAVLNQDTNVIRLLVGYSDKGPFNIPTYIKGTSDFISMYGGINKTQERRGNFFHRTALQMLSVSPILCLNLKKFDGEQVTAATIDTTFNADRIIDTVSIPVTDIYDTTRFWSLDPEKLNEIRGAEYINITTTDVKTNSGTFFIRKASGSKVAAFNITVSDWYKDAGEDIPEFLEGYENELMSSFFAEVYVFGGKFLADQVLSSETLKNYFVVDGDGKLKLRKYVKDGFGDYNDTLDYLYTDETSGAIGHYIGSLIPYFKDKNGNYASLDIIFNVDSDAHHMMMSFNEDMLYEDNIANIDMTGARLISTSKSANPSVVCLDNLWNGTAVTSLLGNAKAPVVTAKVHFRTNVWSDNDTIKHTLSYKKTKKITGNLYVTAWGVDSITLRSIGDPTDITIDLSSIKGTDVTKVLYSLGAAYKAKDGSYVAYESGLGTVYKDTDAYETPENTNGPKKVITSISRDLPSDDDSKIVLGTDTVKCSIDDVYVTTKTEYLNPDTLIDANDKYNSWSVYGPSVTFIPINENWTLTADATADGEAHTYHLTADATDDSTVLSVLQKGDRFLAVDGNSDMDGDGDYDDEVADGNYDLCYVQEVETTVDENGTPVSYSIKFTGNVVSYDAETKSDKDTIVDAETYKSLEKDEQDKFNDKTWKVSYDKVGVKTVNVEEYNALGTKDGFVPTQITSDGVTMIAVTPKPEDYSEEEGKHIATIDGTEYVVENEAISEDITVGDDNEYHVATYTNTSYVLDKVDVEMSDAEYKNIAPIAENPDGADSRYNTIASDYTENGEKKSGACLKGTVNFTATTSEYIKLAKDNDVEVTKYIVRIDNGLNQEIGTMEPTYLKGYTYEHPKPTGVGMKAKVDWQNFQLSALTEYKGLRTGLLNKSEINFRYIIDGFESFVDSGLKKTLSLLAKDKQNASVIANFPSVKTFVKCPYSSFTDAKGVFNVQYVVDGFNKKKSHTTAFSLPSNDEGASFVAFYTPLKVSDGTIDSTIPSAGLVSNLYMEKYNSRLPYDIIAGPNYGAMSVSGLIGPDYNYSDDELNIIEPFGVNCMVYRPSFGTFINANQTAKQTPKSALSSMNVRELVIFIMDEVEKILQAYQWEFNNQTVRNKIKDRADAICARVQANGGIQAYLNVMDSSNNTADIIDNEMAILSTHIEPGRGAGKMVHELTLYRTGQMSSSILGE